MSKTIFTLILIIAFISKCITLNIQSKINQYNPNDVYTEESRKQIEQQIKEQEEESQIPKNILDLIKKQQEQDQVQEKGQEE